MPKLFNHLSLLLLITMGVTPAVAQNKSSMIPFSGKIGNRLPIAVELTITDRKVEGRYSYLNKTEWLRLEGTISGTRLTLVEHEAPTQTSPQGKMTGSFDGMIQLDSTITGTWKNLEGTRVSPFSFTKERFREKPDSVAVTLQDFTDCDCYTGTELHITDTRLSAYVHNILLSNINVEYEDCPCENENGIARGILEERKTITYNKNNILTCVTSTSGVGAYPSSAIHYSNFSLQTGAPVTVQMLFKPAARDNARDYLLRQLTQQIEQVIKPLEISRIEEERRRGKALRESTVSVLETLQSDPWPREFYIGTNNVTFRYQLGYPHHIQSLAPSDELSVNVNELRNYLDPSGPLAFMLVK